MRLPEAMLVLLCTALAVLLLAGCTAPGAGPTDYRGALPHGEVLP